MKPIYCKKGYKIVALILKNEKDSEIPALHYLSKKDSNKLTKLYTKNIDDL